MSIQGLLERPSRRSTGARCRCTAPAAPTPACTRWRRWPAARSPARTTRRRCGARSTRSCRRRARARRSRTCRRDFTPGSRRPARRTGTSCCNGHRVSPFAAPSTPGTCRGARRGGDGGRRPPHFRRHARFRGVPVHRRRRGARHRTVTASEHRVDGRRIGRRRQPLPMRCPAVRLLSSSRSPANGFLRHMVRAMAGTLVEVGRGTPGSREHSGRARSRRTGRWPAPPRRAHGLWLVAVNYC